jgi:hypothetical protein
LWRLSQIGMVAAGWSSTAARRRFARAPSERERERAPSQACARCCSSAPPHTVSPTLTPAATATIAEPARACRTPSLDHLRRSCWPLWNRWSMTRPPNPSLAPIHDRNTSTRACPDLATALPISAHRPPPALSLRDVLARILRTKAVVAEPPEITNFRRYLSSSRP